MPHDERADRSFMTPAVELHRLAQVAHTRGVRLFRDTDGRWLCTSHSHEGLVYYVTGFSCDCPGFVRQQHCTHHALLLDTLGWLPPIEEGSAPAPVTCTSCTAGKIEEWVSGHVAGCKPCDACGGTSHPRPLAPLAA
jgi:hypothetical protein